jgi:hypothetical protein
MYVALASALLAFTIAIMLLLFYLAWENRRENED